MNSISKVLLTVVLAVMLQFACTSPTRRTITGLNALLVSTYEQFAPDDRIELWDVSVHSDSGHFQLVGNLTNQETYNALDEALVQQFPEVENRIILHSAGRGGTLVNALVNNSVIHLRREPSSTRELVTQALLGTPVRILKTEGGKSLIQVPDGYIGWINSAEVHLVDAGELEAYRVAEKVIFTAQYGQAFSDPDKESIPVSDLVIGNILTRVSQESGFTLVRYPDGRLGWVRSEDLVPADEIFYKTALKENLVLTALRYNGIPYLWGGTSSKNIDCSGLVSNIYFLNGIQLPRDADMQALSGRELTTEFNSDQLEPGDLLFFGQKATQDQAENVTHVAMYIGDGEYIHSAGYRERVGINSMDSTSESYIERYPEIFVRAVRILGEEYNGFSPVSENAFYKEIIGHTE